MSSQQRYIPVLAAEDGLASAFLSALAGRPADRIDVPHPSGMISIEAVGNDADGADSFESRVGEADGVIVVAGHLDVAGLDMLKRLLGRIPGDVNLPQAHALHREPGHREFKISCPTCGQKLWVGDSQEGRPGRCPGCKQTFLIPSQVRHLVSNLQLADEVPIRIQFRGDTSSAVALVHALASRLADRMAEKQSRQKNMTMRIVIDGENAK